MTRDPCQNNVIVFLCQLGKLNQQKKSSSVCFRFWPDFASSADKEPEKKRFFYPFIGLDSLQCKVECSQFSCIYGAVSRDALAGFLNIS